jgi:drug/metabolite transporter (DMT)-like permease
VLALAVLAPIWGYGWIVTKVALGDAPPFRFAALRAALSAAMLFGVMLLARRSLRPPPLRWVVVGGLLQTTAFVGCVILALEIGGAGKVAVLVYTMPFWLLLLAWAFLGEGLHGLQWPATVLAFVGLLLVIAPWQGAGALSSVLATLGGLAWAASALVVKLMQRRRVVDVLSFTFWQMVFGSLPLVVAAFVVPEPGIDWTASFTVALAYNVILANGVAWLLWLYALRRLPAGAAGLGTLAVPVVGVLAAWAQLGERPGGVEAAGMVLIIAALSLLAARGWRAGRRSGRSTGEQSGEASGEPVLPPQTD